MLFIIFEKSSVVGFRLGSTYASCVNHQMTYFINQTFRKTGPLEKAHPMPKFTVLVKNTFITLEVADFKYHNNFLNLKPKIIQTRHFWFQVWKFFVLHKILLNDLFRGAEYACICMKHYVPIWARVPNIPESA